MVAAAVTGVRHVEKPDLITINDRFAIASCTKTMTQLAIARVVDLDKLSFDTTIGEVLPEIEMRDVYRKVTLAQLLTFQGGIQPYTMIAGPQAQAPFSNRKEARLSSGWRSSVMYCRRACRGAGDRPELFECQLCGRCFPRGPANGSGMGSADARACVRPARNDASRLWPAVERGASQ